MESRDPVLAVLDVNGAVYTVACSKVRESDFKGNIGVFEWTKKHSYWALAISVLTSSYCGGRCVCLEFQGASHFN